MCHIERCQLHAFHILDFSIVFDSSIVCIIMQAATGSISFTHDFLAIDEYAPTPLLVHIVGSIMIDQ